MARVNPLSLPSLAGSLSSTGPKSTADPAAFLRAVCMLTPAFWPVYATVYDASSKNTHLGISSNLENG